MSSALWKVSACLKTTQRSLGAMMGPAAGTQSLRAMTATVGCESPKGFRRLQESIDSSKEMGVVVFDSLTRHIYYQYSTPFFQSEN